MASVWPSIATRTASSTATNGDPSQRREAQCSSSRPRAAWPGSFGIFCKPEGLTEPEGEIEANFALGQRLGRGVRSRRFLVVPPFVLTNSWLWPRRPADVNLLH